MTSASDGTVLWTLAVIGGMACVTVIARCFFFIFDRPWSLPHWAQRGLHVKGQRCACLVRLVNDDQWAMKRHQVDERKLEAAVLGALKPWRIGITRDYSYTPELLAAITDPGYQFQEIPLNALQLRKLIAGRIDTVPMSLITAFAQIKQEGLEGRLDYLPKPLKSSPYYHVWCKARADADTPALMAAYDAELLHMKRDGRLKALYDKYGIPYLEP